MKNIKKTLSLLLCAVMVTLALCACGSTGTDASTQATTQAPIPPSNAQRIQAALSAIENDSAWELAAGMDITVMAVYGSQRDSVNYVLDMEIKLDNTDAENELSHVSTTLKVPATNVITTSEIYVKDGYTYTNAGGLKTKQKNDDTEATEEDPFTLVLKNLENAVFTEQEDGSLSAKVSIAADKNEEAKKAFIALFDMGMTANQIRLSQIKAVEAEIVIDKENNLRSFSFPVEYSLIQNIPGSSSMYSTIVKYTFELEVKSTGTQISITFPSDLDSYTEAAS